MVSRIRHWKVHSELTNVACSAWVKQGGTASPCRLFQVRMRSDRFHHRKCMSKLGEVELRILKI